MDRYQRAIEKDMVPLSIIDIFFFYFGPVFAICAGSILFYIVALKPNQFTSSQKIFFTILVISFVAIGIYGAIILRKKFRLTFLSNTLPLSIKESVILKLAKENSWRLDRRKECYYRFQDPFKWTKYPDNITIIYSENGFYVNVIDSRWKAIDFGTGKRMAKEIVQKIRQLAQQ